MRLIDEEERLIMVRMVLDITRMVHSEYFPPGERFGSRMETLYVCLAIALGHMENRPLTVSKLANFIEMPRPTVLRKLEQLERWQLITRRAGRLYLCVDRYNTPTAVATSRRLRRLVLAAVAALSKMDTSEG
jgi:hypothetical protein